MRHGPARQLSGAIGTMLRVRLKYEKTGPIRFVSHRDLMRILRRAFASAEIPVCYSQGFNPHPRFSFGPSLRTGWEGRDEYLDALLERPIEEVPERCTRHLPEGLRILESGPVGDGAPKLAADITGARYDVYIALEDAYRSGAGEPRQRVDTVSAEPAPDELRRRAGVLETLAAGILERFGADRPRTRDGETDETRPPVALEARCSEAIGETDTSVRIEYFSTMHGGKSLFPEDVLTPFLGEPAHYASPVRVVRSALYVERGGKYVSPLSRAALETMR